MLKTYFNANIKPIIQNGLLFKGCVNLSTLDPLFMAQRKVLPMINLIANLIAYPEIALKIKYWLLMSFMYMFDVLHAFFQLPTLNYVFKHHAYAVRKLI